jgi:Zn-dependent membrane protease YugP
MMNGKTEIVALEFEFEAAMQALEILTRKLQERKHQERKHWREALRAVAAMTYDLERAREMFNADHPL